MCIPEEYSFCSSIDSDSNEHSLNSEDDIGSKEVELRGGKEMSVSEAYEWNNDLNENDDNNNNNDNDVSDYNERKILSNNSISKCKECLKCYDNIWKKKKKLNRNGKRKDKVKVTQEEDEEEEEVEEVLKKEKARSGKQEIDRKKSAGFWMKNQKNGVLLE